MRRGVLRTILALAPVLLAGCAGKRIRLDNAQALAVADGRVLEGCYLCLLDARDTYARLATSTHADRDTVALRLFETSLLIVLREKELALDWDASVDRARALSAGVPRSIDAGRLLAIVGAVMPDGTGRPGDWPVALRRELRPFVERVPDEIAWLATTPLRPVVRDYIALALDCSHDARVLAPVPQRGTRQRRPVLPPDAPPVITYRTGICLSTEPAMLAAVIALVPRFHEAAYFAGSAAAFLAEEDGGATAAPLLAQAFDHFPRAPGVSFMRGWLSDAIGECGEAVRHFDTVLDLDPGHEFALLQRTICLSRLHKDTAAIASATTLIDLRTGSTQPAYYWRAVSRLRLKEVSAARSDIDSAKALARDANALTLGGIIASEQGELALAEQDLREARALPRGDQNCTAAWTLALVIGRNSRPAEAAQAFEAAMDCYDIKVAVARSTIAQLLQRPTRYPAHRARRIAALAADSADQRKRFSASAFNAAGQTANTGNLVRAVELLDVAARDTTLAAPVATLRKAIADASKKSR